MFSNLSLLLRFKGGNDVFAPSALPLVIPNPNMDRYFFSRFMAIAVTGRQTPTTLRKQNVNGVLAGSS